MSGSGGTAGDAVNCVDYGTLRSDECIDAAVADCGRVVAGVVQYAGAGDVCDGTETPKYSLTLDASSASTSRSGTTPCR